MTDYRKPSVHVSGEARRRAVIGLSTVNQIGNWLTFLAIITYAQQQFGSGASAGIFVCQTIPGLLIAGRMRRRIAAHHARSAWVAAQILLAVLTMALGLSAAYRSLWVLMLYTTVAMLIRAVVSPFFMTFATDFVPHAERKGTLAGISASGSVALMLAPATGGALIASSGPSMLFVIDAITFLASAVAGSTMRPLAPVSDEPARRSGSSPERRGSDLVQVAVPEPVPLTRLSRRDPVLLSWLILLTLGALLNGLEAPLSLATLGLTTTQLGIMLSLFGLGGIVTLVAALLPTSKSLPVGWAVAAYGAGLVSWVLFPNPGPYVGFFLVGLGMTALSGLVRGRLDSWGKAMDVSSHRLWAWVNQSTLWVNATVYGLVTLVFTFSAPWPVLVGALFGLFVPLCFALRSGAGS